jgi:hypothetical protein
MAGNNGTIGGRMTNSNGTTMGGNISHNGGSTTVSAEVGWHFD